MRHTKFSTSTWTFGSTSTRSMHGLASTQKRPNRRSSEPICYFDRDFYCSLTNWKLREKPDRNPIIGCLCRSATSRSKFGANYVPAKSEPTSSASPCVPCAIDSFRLMPGASTSASNARLPFRFQSTSACSRSSPRSLAATVRNAP